ncbi:MAG: class I SAM-dependent methyltransferase [Gammaproteobacteria bacterium]|nr:class I SAM-dependent methyltransferase [Gammaproteobacteria bacterium]
MKSTLMPTSLSLTDTAFLPTQLFFNRMLADPPLVLQKRSSQLVQDIKENIAAHQGWIGFDSFMHQALYTSDLGYYAGGMQKFGEDGDFITAPMLGDFFAFALAKQCDEIFSRLNAETENSSLSKESPTKERAIMEFGAGDGRLAVELLRQMEQQGLGIDHYFIVETSNDLQQRQKEAVANAGLELASKVSWLQCLPESGFDGIVIGNELLDALPVKRFMIDERGEAMEVGVAIEDQQLIWQRSDHRLDPAYQARLAQYHLPMGYHSEIGIQAEAWVRSVGEKLTSGVMLLIDYGFCANEYYHPDRFEGTMMCHYRHHAHGDPFFYPGLQDITAHIDFSAMAAAAKEVGLKLCGYSPQGGFLLSLGVLDHLAACQERFEEDPKKYFELSSQIKTLTLPHEMGELFKVMVLSKSPIGKLTGFSLQDHRARL